MNGQGSKGEGPDKEVISLMKDILSNKPLSCDDIASIDHARKELRRIRKLMDNFKSTNKNGDSDKKDAPLSSAKKGARNAIHEQENINDYVKKVVPKDAATREMIHTSIKSNVMFADNTEDELTEIIDVFESCTFVAGETVIQQGEKGDDFYVVEAGELSISVNIAQDGDDQDGDDAIKYAVKVGNYSDGNSFGELALIYGSPRAATIEATEICKLWRIKRGWYRGVVGQHIQRLHREKVEFLPQVNIGKQLFKDVLTKGQLDSMAQLLKQEYFKKGETIVREGEAGNTFYIIQNGEVEIYKKQLGTNPIAVLPKGKFFGEKALVKDDARAATVVAKSTIVVCYVMTRGDFTRVLGNFQDILDGKTTVKGNTLTSAKAGPTVNYKLAELDTLNVLGEGAFGKVKLVKAKDTGKYYALKAQGKQFVIDNGQKVYVINEMKLMQKLTHPNILVMHCAMQDPKYIYFLLECLPGGELMNLLEMKRGFSEDWVRFYSASVLLAYTEFHAKRVAYRDLKPENLVLNDKGYCVVVDLGLAKQLEDGPTYTFCGTPDYIAPELIRGTGYNWAVDYWALGVLLYELHSGGAPFQSYDPTGTAKKILKGNISFPSKFSSQMKQVIKALLMKDPTRRLGCMNDGTDGVMKHRFYHGFDWQGLLEMKIDVPYKPKLPSNMSKLGKKDIGGDNAKATNWNPSLE